MTLPELMKKKVYLLGTLSGNPIAVTNAYRAAEELLDKHKIYNRKSPFDNPDLEDRFRTMDNIEWNKLVRQCITDLMECDALIMLPDSDSKFCKNILAAAMSADIPLIDTDYFHKILQTTPQTNPTSAS